MSKTRSQHPHQGAVGRRDGCVTLDEWLLTPEGGIIHAAERTAVIADVHLGYEWARGAAGDCVPAHSLGEAVARLECLLVRSPVDHLVIAGDLVESVRPCRQTLLDVARLWHWLDDRGIRLTLVRGNHDRGLDWFLRPRVHALPAVSVHMEESLSLSGWTIVHGHGPTSAGKVVRGHHHPVLRFAGRTFPCFVTGPGQITLPAFTRNAAGFNVSAASRTSDWLAPTLRCLASTGAELLDLGPVQSLASALRARRFRPG